MTTTIYSYKEALIHRLLHKEGIQKVNKLIEDAQTRYSMSKYDEDENNSPQWCFGTNGIQFQCINCILCSGYIERSSWTCHSKDPIRLIKNIYCDDINHHSITNRNNGIKIIKKLLKIYDISKNESYLYHASLEALILNNDRLHTFYAIFIEFLGISFHLW